MPIVFVHGVNTRAGKALDQENLERDAQFRRQVLARWVQDPDAAHIGNPYWGDLGASPRWNHASLPPDDAPRFGTGRESAAVAAAESATVRDEGPSTVVLELARESFPEAVDLLFAYAADASVAAEAEELEVVDLVELAARAVDYADHNPAPAWLTEVGNDDELFERLRQEVSLWLPRSLPGAQYESGGAERFSVSRLWGRVREGVTRVAAAAGAAGSRAVLAAVRAPMHKAVSRFIGDVLVYVDEAQPIADRVVASLEAATAARSPRDPYLVVVAHSMGGNVVYDILSGIRPDLEVDALVTVGSQVAFFEELELFEASDPSMPQDPVTDRVSRPANVGAWLNIFDRNDVLAYATQGVFEGTQDFEYSTGKGFVLAHGSYFRSTTFHARLGEKLAEILIP